VELWFIKLDQDLLPSGFSVSVAIHFRISLTGITDNAMLEQLIWRYKTKHISGAQNIFHRLLVPVISLRNNYRR
jgi:hypothetical protein